jgi:hypothetical protein
MTARESVPEAEARVTASDPIGDGAIGVGVDSAGPASAGPASAGLVSAGLVSANLLNADPTVDRPNTATPADIALPDPALPSTAAAPADALLPGTTAAPANTVLPDVMLPGTAAAPADTALPDPALHGIALPDPALPGTAAAPADAPLPGVAARPLVPRWCGVVLIVLGLMTVPWIAGLAVSLPNRVQTDHYAFSWAGFDVLLASLLLWTGWRAVRNREDIGVSAAVTGGLLVVDAWFDVTGAASTMQFVAALAMALFVELPLACFCLWLSGRAESARRRRTARMIAMVGRLWQYRSRALRRIRPLSERR